MILIYELTIWLSDDEHSWSVDHRFGDRPCVETIKYLLDEAKKVFEDIFSTIPTETGMSLEYLTKADREDARKLTVGHNQG